MNDKSYRVLIVDDVETNLYAAKNLMEPCKFQIDTASNGSLAIELIEGGNTYDLIFMDHLMPGLDGVETTKVLRRKGYQGTIIALTASTEPEELILESGLDDSITKPINPLNLKSILEKWLDGLEVVISQPLSFPSCELRNLFRKDAEKAIITLRQTIEKNDMQLFKTTIHAMKSALANIGEDEKSKLANELEIASRNGDNGFIIANIDCFIKSLEDLVVNFTSDEVVDDILIEDLDYLLDELNFIKEACENYDEVAAYEAINRLSTNKLKGETRQKISDIRELLFLESDFEATARFCESYINQIQVYLNTLTITARLLPERINRMDRFLENNDSKSFAIEVHGLKSVLRIIGAYALGSDAEELENKAMEARATCTELHLESYPDFRVSLLDLSNKLNMVIPETDKSDEIVDIDMFIRALGEAKVAAAKFDSVRASEILMPFNVFSYAGEIKPLLEETINTLLVFDCEKAIELIEKMEEAAND